MGVDLFRFLDHHRFVLRDESRRGCSQHLFSRRYIRVFPAYTRRRITRWSKSHTFDWIVIILVLMSTVVLASEYYGQPGWLTYARGKADVSHGEVSHVPGRAQKNNRQVLTLTIERYAWRKSSSDESCDCLFVV